VNSRNSGLISRISVGTVSGFSAKCTTAGASKLKPTPVNCSAAQAGEMYEK
jgi:hypothetical protein